MILPDPSQCARCGSTEHSEETCTCESPMERFQRIQRTMALGLIVESFIKEWERPANWTLADLVRKVAHEQERMGNDATAKLYGLIAEWAESCE